MKRQREGSILGFVSKKGRSETKYSDKASNDSEVENEVDDRTDLATNYGACGPPELDQNSVTIPRSFLSKSAAICF